MVDLLTSVIDSIDERNSLHAKKLRTDIKALDSSSVAEANSFLGRYSSMLENQGKDLEYAVDCYQKFLDDILVERVHFLRTGGYSSTSFAEVNERVYGNPDVMSYYMHALLLSQVLWHQHFKIGLFFDEVMKDLAGNCKNYLEVGGGHGLYVRSFAKIAGDAAINVVDISPTSLKMCEILADAPKAEYILSDVYEFEGGPYDVITMGEVMEHVEDPVSLLKKLKELCSPDGHVFVTTPTNAPAIDHIYLFKTTDDIRKVIHEAGFDIIKEVEILTEKPTSKAPKASDIAVLYGALMQPKKPI